MKIIKSTKLKGELLLGINYKIWECQRPISESWVNEIYNKQLEFFNKYGELCFPGVISLVFYKDEYYIIDGQHRYEAIKRLSLKKEGIKYMKFTIQIFNCDNKDEVEDLYIMTNSNYNSNASLEILKKRPKEMIHLNKIKKVVKIMEKIYSTQASHKTNRAPYFEIGTFTKELVSNKNCNDRSVNEIINEIKRLNIIAREGMVNETHKKKVKNLSSFYLPYHEPKCRWVKLMFKYFF
jgi:hypothetical protein